MSADHGTPAEPDGLRWARELQAIAQIGLTYSTERHFDAARYARVREIAAEIMCAGGKVELPRRHHATFRHVIRKPGTDQDRSEQRPRRLTPPLRGCTIPDTR